MKKLFFLSLLAITSFTGLKASDLNNDLIELAKIYRNFMFRNAATETAFEQLDKISASELSTTTKFVRETITSANQLTTKEFLTLPDESALKYIYIVKKVNWNLREEAPRNNNELIAELTDKAVSRYELIDSYYGMLFSAVGNKNQPFDLSALNFKTNNYGLKDDTEKGIFFLKAMDLCGTSIWGYMNIVNPPNYKKAMSYIKLFPTFNDQPYYQYLDFGFEDFEMQILKDKPAESYKGYYLNKYYDTLLAHLGCLSQKKKQEKERYDLLLGSILKEERYYKYSKKKTVLDGLFSEVKR
jgi:hypothetical protein